MNIHHLELFYYVAKHGGIAAAVRAIPYGIQQPAVSGQIAKLEESLGVKLFTRRPFALSPAGVELFHFVEPFFANLQPLAAKIRGRALPQLRIAAPSLALHDHLPDLLHRLRAKFPDFKLHLHEAGQAEAERLVQAQEVDLAITVLEKKPRAGLHSKPLVKLPLVLLVQRDDPLRDAAELWARDTIEQPLITFPEGEPVRAQFQRGLEERGVEWYGGIEVNSIRLIECYVANGFGIGLAVAAPGVGTMPEVRCIPLHDFPGLTMGAIWNGDLAPIARQFLEEVEAQVKTMGTGEWAV